MGFWSRVFSDSSDGSTTRVRQSNQDNSKSRGDKYEHCGEGKHTHIVRMIQTRLRGATVNTLGARIHQTGVIIKSNKISSSYVMTTKRLSIR